MAETEEPPSERLNRLSVERLNERGRLEKELEEAKDEIARLRAGEAEDPGHMGTAPTPEQWIRRFNDQEPEGRLFVAESVMARAKDHEMVVAFVDKEIGLNQPFPLVTAIGAVQRLAEHYKEKLAEAKRENESWREATRTYNQASEDWRKRAEQAERERDRYQAAWELSKRDYQIVADQLFASCICNLDPETTQGPEETCPVHGADEYRPLRLSKRAQQAERELAEARAAIERLSMTVARILRITVDGGSDPGLALELIANIANDAASALDAPQRHEDPDA